MENVIKVFVATKETQGQRANDFCFVPEGEVVTFPSSVCTNQKADDSCGCARSLTGTKTHKATTTAKVALLQGGKPQLLLTLREFLHSAGWAEYMTPEEQRVSIEEDARELIRVASMFAVGDVVEYRDGVMTQRRKECQDER